MEESLSVLNESKLQMFRVNCYNISSRVLINGKNQHLFLTSILPCILNKLSDKSGLMELNRIIKTTFEQYLTLNNTNIYSTMNVPSTPKSSDNLGQSSQTASSATQQTISIKKKNTVT